MEDFRKHTLDTVRAVNINKIKKLFSGEDTSKDGKIFYKYFIKPRKVIQWGGLADPFCPYEKRFKVGKKILQFFADIKYPISLSTKSTLCAEPEYLDIFKQSPETFHVKFSIITNNEEHAKKIEVGVPSPQQRFDAMKTLSSIGVSTTLRLRPFMFGTSDKTYVQLIENSAKAGAESMSLEFFCLEMRAGPEIKKRYRHMSDVLGFNIVEFYKKLSVHPTYLRLNRKIKKPYVIHMRDLSHKNNMTFHVSDPHFKELGDHGCCCGIPATKNKHFANYCKGQLTEVITKAKNVPQKEIKIDDILKDLEWAKEIDAGKPFNFGSAHGHRVRRHLTLYDFFKNSWNNPNSGKSPYKYFTGKMKPVRLDKNKNIIYKYEEGKE